MNVIGFETMPRGQLLKQVLVLDRQMGIAYERSVGYVKDFHAHDRDILIFPRGSCRMEILVGEENQKHTVSSTQLLYIPKDLSHADRALSAVYDTVALLPSSQYMTELINENGLDSMDAERLRGGCLRFQRTRWMDDLIERYFFEMIINSNSPLGCSFFLEKQILNEFARMVFTEKLVTTGTLLGEESEELMARSLRYIEAHLFESMNIKLICKHLRTTESTLIRLFRKHLDQTPGVYIKARKLDEAAALLERGDHQVGDVCMLIGYEDISSFTKSFKQRFKVSPSKYRDKLHLNI